MTYRDHELDHKRSAEVHLKQELQNTKLRVRLGKQQSQLPISGDTLLTMLGIFAFIVILVISGISSLFSSLLNDEKPDLGTVRGWGNPVVHFYDGSKMKGGMPECWYVKADHKSRHIDRRVRLSCFEFTASELESMQWESAPWYEFDYRSALNNWYGDPVVLYYKNRVTNTHIPCAAVEAFPPNKVEYRRVLVPCSEFTSEQLASMSRTPLENTDISIPRSSKKLSQRPSNETSKSHRPRPSSSFTYTPTIIYPGDY